MANDPLPNRPPFALPFPAGTVCHIKTYVGHNPDDMKMDIYADGWPNDSAVLAAAAGMVHEHFYPGGIEINHGNGWFTTYMHMDRRAAVGTRVNQGSWVGRADIVDTRVKHLHHEQLYAGPGATDADNEDITYPVIQGQGPLHLVPGEPGITMVSTNGRAQPPKDAAGTRYVYTLQNGGLHEAYTDEQGWHDNWIPQVGAATAVSAFKDATGTRYVYTIE